MAFKAHFMGWNLTHKAVIPGRATYISAIKSTSLGSKLVISWNIHNHDIDSPALYKIEKIMKPQIAICKNDPINDSLFVSGDLKLPPAGQVPLYLPQPQRNRISNTEHGNSSHVAPLRPLQRRWEALLSPLVEAAIESHTHVNISTMRTCTLDRIFHSLSRSSIPSIQHTGGIVRSPVDWVPRSPLVAVFVSPPCQQTHPSHPPPPRQTPPLQANH